MSANNESWIGNFQLKIHHASLFHWQNHVIRHVHLVSKTHMMTISYQSVAHFIQLPLKKRRSPLHWPETHKNCSSNWVIQLNGSSWSKLSAVSFNCKTISNANIVYVQFLLVFVCNKLAQTIYKKWWLQQISLVQRASFASVFYAYDSSLIAHFTATTLDTIKIRTQIQVISMSRPIFQKNFFFSSQNNFPMQ